MDHDNGNTPTDFEMIAYLERLQQEQETHDEAHAETGSTSKKKRGPTLGLPIWRRMTQVIVVYDHIGNPIAPKSVVKDLITFIGCLARMSEYCPIDFASWTKVPSDGKEKAWKQIEKRFSTNQSDVGVKTNLIALIGKAWKEFRNDLKNKYYVQDNRQASINNMTDKRVKKEQWAVLVDFWGSQEVQKEAERNKENRSKLKRQHTLGRMSLARKRQEMVEKDKDGKSPTRGELFITSHTRKDGTIHKSATEEVKKVNDVLAAFEGDENQIEKSGPNDVVSQALGNGGHGRIISVGFRATTTNTWKSNERSGIPVVANNAAQEEINALKAQLAAYQVLHEELAAKVTKLTELVENQQGQLRTINLGDA